MMNFEEFVTNVKETLEQELGESTVVSETKTLKNNGVERVGLTIIKKPINISPTIYMEEFYTRYQNGWSMEEVVELVLDTYRQVRFEHSWQVHTVRDFDIMRSKIVYKLINMEKNEKLLENLPYVPYMDMAIVFYVLFEIDEDGTATIPITNDLIMLWDTDVEKLHKLATENSPKLLPSVFKTMNSVIEELQGVTFEEEEDDILYVLTNTLKSFGASCILYENVLEKIGEDIGENYYILPSSIHETIIVPQSNSPSHLEELLKEVNETQVDREEILSNNVYYYDTKTGILSIANGMENQVSA